MQLFAARARAPSTRPPLLPRRSRLGLSALLAAGVLVSVVGFSVGMAAWGVRQAAAQAELATRTLANENVEAAAAALSEAERQFARAAFWIDAPFGRLAGVVPGLRASVHSIRELAEAGTLLTGGGARVLAAVDSLPGGLAGLAPEDGAIPVDAAAALAGPLAAAAESADAAAAILDAPRAGMLPPLAAARDQLAATARQARDGLAVGADVTRALPALLGDGGPRRYLFVASNPAELRGTGGFHGAYSVLEARRGRLELGPFASIHELARPAEPPAAPYPDFDRRYGSWFALNPWLNANLTPQFPAAASLLVGLHADATGEQLDGVIVADPFALEALLGVAGPAQVPGVGSVDAGNVVEVVTNRAYRLFDSEQERKEALGAVAVQAVGGFLAGGVSPLQAARALGEAAADGHLHVFATDPDVQAALESAGLAGVFPQPHGDFLAVVGNNGAQNKADFYTERVVRYVVDLQPGGAAGAGLGVRLTNDAPTDGLPAHIIGPNLDHLDAGDNLTYLSVYCAASCELAGFSGLERRFLTEDTELGHPVFSAPVHLAAGHSRDLSWSWRLVDVWQGGEERGRYRLTVRDQPTVPPTRVVVEVTPPPGTRIVRATPGMTVRDGVATYDGPVARDLVLDVEFRRATRVVWQPLRELLTRPVFRLGADAP